MKFAKYTRFTLPLALVWAAVLLFALAIVAEPMVSKISLVIGLFVALGTPFSAQLQKLDITPLALGVFAAATIAIEVVVSCGWLGYRVFVQRSAADVIDKVTSNRRLHDLVDGSARTLTLDLAGAEDRRDVLILGLEIAATRPAAGVCAALTRLTLDVAKGGEGHDEIAVGEEARVAVVPGARQVSIELRVRNINGDGNCPVDVRVSKALLSYR